MTTFPQDSRPGGVTPRPGPGLGAAGGPPVRASAAAPEGHPTAVRGTTERTGGASHPLASPVLKPAPADAPSTGPGSGQVEPLPAPVSPAAPSVVATTTADGAAPSRNVGSREGTAGSGTPPPGPASTSPSAAEGTAGGARDREAGVRTVRAGLPPANGPEGAGHRQVNPAPSGATGLSGKAFRDAVRAAQSAQAADRRRGRGKRPVKRQGDGYGPGMTRRLPPGGAT
jgi:hypothetical protein